MLHLIATPDQMAQLLAASRRQAGLTQAEAAARLGISQSRISALETDAGALTLAQLLALCGIYGLQLQVRDKSQPAPEPAPDRRVVIMARQTHSRALSVWANGERVGVWRLPARGPMEFAYDPAWAASPAGRPLSLSLPFTPGNRRKKGPRVLNYFDNLLPDSEAIRKRIAQRYQTETLMRSTCCKPSAAMRGRRPVACGRRRAGRRRPDRGTPLSGRRDESLLARTVSKPALGAPDEKRRLPHLARRRAGEDRAAVARRQMARPHGATPTTHIFKLPLGLVGNKPADLSTSVENEWLCLRILRAYGLPVANTEIMTFGKQRVLSVERFDRQMHSSGQLAAAPAAGRLLPGVRRAVASQIRKRRRPRRARPRADPAAVGRGPAGHRNACWPARSCSGCWRRRTATRRISAFACCAGGQFPPDAALRRDVDLAGGRQRPQPVVMVQGQARDGHVVAQQGDDAFRDVQRRHFNTMALKCSYGAHAEPLIQRLIERPPM